LVRKSERQSDCGEIQLSPPKESFELLNSQLIENVLKGGRVLFVSEVPVSLPCRSKHADKTLILWISHGSAAAVIRSDVCIAQLADSKALNCYKRYFWQRKYATPGHLAAASLLIRACKIR